MSEVLTIGEPMAVFASTEADVPLAVACNYDKFLAGAEVNVAVGVARLGHTVDYVAQVGADPIGDFVRAELTKANVGTDHVVVTPTHTTGLMFKQRVTAGDPATANYRKNSAAANLMANQIETLNLDGVKIAHLTGIFPAISATARETTLALCQRLAMHPEIVKIFDTNLRPALWETTEEMVATTNQFAKMANIVLPGINEGEILMGSRDPETIADFFIGQSAVTDTVIVKLGPAGAFVKTRDGQTMTVPGLRVAEVVDTVGAGDGFALGVITGLLDGLDLYHAVQRGNAVGAMAVQAAGDNDGYPTLVELEAFMAQPV